MKNIQLLIAYDGTHFLGWQKTKLGPSIEETLQGVISQILQEDITLQAASRTDAGVHAEGQSVNFFTNKELLSLVNLQKSINALLPATIRVLHIEEKNLAFHPTLDSIGKEYQYYICNTPYQLPRHRLFSWHVSHPLSLKDMERAALDLLGTHDFSAFCNERASLNKDPVCTIHSITINLLPNDQISISIIGNRFLYKMMRNLIGTLVYVGLKKIEVSEVKNILQNKQRTLAGITAPAHGLHLIRVFYKQEQQK